MIKFSGQTDRADPIEKVIVADLHLHQLQEWRLQWCDEFVDELLNFQSVVDGDLILLGDALEVRDKVDSRVANLLIELLKEWDGAVYWLTGQHDSYQPYMATFHALDMWDDHGPFVIDHEPYKDGEGNWYVPYARDPEKYRGWLADIPSTGTIYTHMPIVEVLEQFPGDIPEGWIKQKDFDRFSAVFSGDIHNRCQYGKVQYIGAVSQRDWRDAGVDGCIATVTKSGKLVRHPVMHPRHIKVTSREGLENLPPGEKLLRIQGFDITEAELRHLRAEPGILGADWEPAPVEEIVEDLPDVTEMDDPSKVLVDYVGSLALPDDGLSDEFLLEVGEELLRENK